MLSQTQRTDLPIAPMLSDRPPKGAWQPGRGRARSALVSLESRGIRVIFCGDGAGGGLQGRGRIQSPKRRFELATDAEQARTDSIPGEPTRSSLFSEEDPDA